MSYALSRKFTAKSFEQAAELVKKSFVKNGFGMPPGTTDLSFHKVFASKGIDDNYKPSHVFGFCNPKHAYSVLTKEPEIAVFLPCSVVLTQEGETDFMCTTINPEAMLGMVDHKEELAATINEIGQMVNTALAEIGQDSE